MQSIKLQCNALCSLLDMSCDTMVFLPWYTDLSAQPVTAHSDWKLHILPEMEPLQDEMNICAKVGEICGPSSANQSFFKASQTSCHVHFTLCLSLLTSLYHTLPTSTGPISTAQLRLVTSDLIMTVLINWVKTPNNIVFNLRSSGTPL